MNLNHVAIAVPSLDPALTFYRTLGLQPFVHSDGYARLRCPEGLSTLSLIEQPVGQGGGAITLYFETTALSDKVHALRDAGLTFTHDVLLQPWGWEEARLTDPFGHVVCLFSAGPRRFTT